MIVFQSFLVSLTLGGNFILEKESPFPYGNVFDELRPPLFFGIPRDDSIEPMNRFKNLGIINFYSSI